MGRGGGAACLGELVLVDDDARELVRLVLASAEDVVAAGEGGHLHALGHRGCGFVEAGAEGGEGCDGGVDDAARLRLAREAGVVAAAAAAAAAAARGARRSIRGLLAKGHCRNLQGRVTSVERVFEHASGTLRERVYQLLRGLARRWLDFRLVAGRGLGHSDEAGADNNTDASPCDASERRHKGQ